MSHAVTEPRRHRLTVSDYYRMGEVGIFAPDARVELIDGEVVDMAPISSQHAAVVDTLANTLRRACERLGLVRTQGPISLDENTEPQPDVTLLRPRADAYFSAHPRAPDVLLIVEVAATSLDYDRDVKVPLYARHSVREVWLVDLAARRLTRYRDPTRAAYARIDEPDLGAALTIDALADVRIDLTTLFP